MGLIIGIAGSLLYDKGGLMTVNRVRLSPKSILSHDI